MSENVSDVPAEELKSILKFADETIEDSPHEATYPSHISEAMMNRIEKGDDDKVTVNNSHIRIIINSINRATDGNIEDEELEETIEKISEQTSTGNEGECPEA